MNLRMWDNPEQNSSGATIIYEQASEIKLRLNSKLREMGAKSVEWIGDTTEGISTFQSYNFCTQDEITVIHLIVISPNSVAVFIKSLNSKRFLALLLKCLP